MKIFEALTINDNKEICITDERGKTLYSGKAVNTPPELNKRLLMDIEYTSTGIHFQTRSNNI
ncbi:MAG: hypothetical protein RR598_09850 [Anaerorhabdus sp.]|uniref:hypothetical protein n=1 Tax=Anaerorhabdus sp. TaxID=1872524 RepID=UPI002FC743DC